MAGPGPPPRPLSLHSGGGPEPPFRGQYCLQEGYAAPMAEWLRPSERERWPHPQIAECCTTGSSHRLPFTCLSTRAEPLLQKIHQPRAPFWSVLMKGRKKLTPSLRVDRFLKASIAVLCLLCGHNNNNSWFLTWENTPDCFLCFVGNITPHFLLAGDIAILPVSVPSLISPLPSLSLYRWTCTATFHTPTAEGGALLT